MVQEKLYKNNGIREEIKRSFPDITKGNYQSSRDKKEIQEQ